MNKDVKEMISLIEEGSIEEGDKLRLLKALEKDMLADAEKMALKILQVEMKDADEGESFEEVPINAVDEDWKSVDLSGIDSIRINLKNEASIRASSEKDGEPALKFKADNPDKINAGRVENELIINNEDIMDGDAVNFIFQGAADIPVNITVGEGYFIAEGLEGNFTFSGHSAKVYVEDYSGEKLHLSTVDSGIEIYNAEGGATMKTASGDVRAENFLGSLYMETASGDASFENIEGNINMTTCSGDVHGENVEGEITIRNISGDVELFDTSGKVELSTNSGDVECEKSSGEFLISSFSGDVELSKATLEKCTIAAISGDVELDLDFLEEGCLVLARTTSGDISIKLPSDIDGEVEAETMTGRIRNRLKMESAEIDDENKLKGRLAGEDYLDLPRIALKSVSGRIKMVR